MTIKHRCLFWSHITFEVQQESIPSLRGNRCQFNTLLCLSVHQCFVTSRSQQTATYVRDHISQNDKLCKAERGCSPRLIWIYHKETNNFSIVLRVYYLVCPTTTLTTMVVEQLLTSWPTDLENTDIGWVAMALTAAKPASMCNKCKSYHLIHYVYTWYWSGVLNNTSTISLDPVALRFFR